MSSLPPTTFANLLRRYRQAAGLTQEELAERARLSVQAIGALERGDRRAPRKETIDLLAEALSLTEPERAVFEATARQRGQADQTTPGEIIHAEATLPAPADEDTNVRKSLHRQDREWHSPHPEPERLPVPHSRNKLVGSMVSVLVVVLLGGALLLKGVPLPWGTPLLCGGALTLATDLPTLGIEGVTEGQPAEYAVNLAVMQHQNLGGGYTLKAVNYDDSSELTVLPDPSIGAGNVQQLVKNPCILGMVGPLHSDVAVAEMPIAATAGLVMISPASTNPGLTLRPYAEAQGSELASYYGDQYAGIPGLNFDQIHPPGKPINYFRIVSNDAVQVVADANLTFDLGAKSVYVVNGPTPYAELLGGGFTQAFEVKGGRVVGSDSLGLDPSVIPAVAARIVAANPDAIFYGSWDGSSAGLLKAELVRLGYRGPFVGSDGIANDPRFTLQAGTSAANGTFASAAGRDPSTFTSGAAAQFVSDYSARHSGQGPFFYSAEAYDAAMVLITAIKHLIATGQAVTRAALIDQVQHIQYAGVTGPISFDANGDISHGVFSIYAVRDGKWVYAWQVSV